MTICSKPLPYSWRPIPYLDFWNDVDYTLCSSSMAWYPGSSIYPIWSWHTSPWISWTSLQEVQNRQCFGQENRIFTYLPITAVCFSISQQPWLAAYIQARQHFSLSISGALFQPLLPQKLHDELVLHAAWTFFGTDHQAPPPYLSRSYALTTWSMHYWALRLNEVYHLMTGNYLDIILTKKGFPWLLIKGSLVEKLPIYEWDRSSIAQSSHSSVKSQLSQVIAQSSHSSVKS